MTLNPFLANIIDKVIPAGPAPIIAILSFLDSTLSNLTLYKYSPEIYSSISQKLTGSLFIPLIQFPLH